MKKTVLWILTFMLFLGNFSASAETLAYAGGRQDMRVLARYPSFALDENSGKWTVRSNMADALVERFWQEAGNYSQGYCVFFVDVEGNAKTGIWTPVLRVYYGYTSSPLEVTAVSLLVDGVRYDLAARAVQVEQGREEAEVISAPLTQEALCLLDALQAGKEISIRLCGETMYTSTLNPTSDNSRRKIEAASLTGVQASAALLKETGLEDYALWDRSAAAWEEEYGFAPRFAMAPLTLAIGDGETEDLFGMVREDERSQAALNAQQALIDGGFLSGTAGRTFTQSASKAARRAQKYYGMIETGCVDASLLQALQSGVAATEAEEVEYAVLDSIAGVALERYWFAKGVSAARGMDAVRGASNQDHLLLAADGWITNLSSEELRMFMQLEARVIYRDAYAFEATILCERDQRSALDLVLLPLAQARVLIYAEIPAHLAQDADANWRIEISAQDEIVVFELE